MSVSRHVQNFVQAYLIHAVGLPGKTWLFSNAVYFGSDNRYLNIIIKLKPILTSKPYHQRPNLSQVISALDHGYNLTVERWIDVPWRIVMNVIWHNISTTELANIYMLYLARYSYMVSVF